MQEVNLTPIDEAVLALAQFIMLFGQMNMVATMHYARGIDQTGIALNERADEVLSWCAEQMEQLAQLGAAYDNLEDMEEG